MPEIVSLSEKRVERETSPLPEIELNRRRLAMQIALQLPGEPLEAIAVLQAALVLVKSFYCAGGL